MAKIKTLLMEKEKKRQKQREVFELSRRSCFDECLQEAARDYPEMEAGILAEIAEGRCIERDVIPPGWNTLVHCKECGWVLVDSCHQKFDRINGCPWCHVWIPIQRQVAEENVRIDESLKRFEEKLGKLKVEVTEEDIWDWI